MSNFIKQDLMLTTFDRFKNKIQITLFVELKSLHVQNILNLIVKREVTNINDFCRLLFLEEYKSISTLYFKCLCIHVLTRKLNITLCSYILSRVTNVLSIYK